MLSPLLTLKRILQETAQVESRDQMVDLVVRHISSSMSVDVCSLYLMNDQQELVLSATQGLAAEAVGKISMVPGQGLVGTIAATQHLLNLEYCDQHPNYLYFRESGEERYQGFLGVPLIHHGHTLGVLVVQVRVPRKFTEEEEAFLVTLAAHLAGSLSATLADSGLETESAKKPVRQYTGIAGAPGVAIAKVMLVRDDVDLKALPMTKSDDVALERERLYNAIEATLEDLESSMGRLSDHAGETLNALLEVYQMLLESPELSQAFDRWMDEGYSATSALREGFLEQIAIFEGMEDLYLRSRAEDLRVLANKVYGRLTRNEPSSLNITEPVILAGQLVNVSHFAKVPQGMLAGVISKEGSALSHTSILANALGVPAVMAAEDLDLRRLDGEEIILDGNRGQVLVNPPEPVLEEFQRLLRQAQALEHDLSYLKNLPAETLDGEQVKLMTNTGLQSDLSPGLERGAEGIGLYRSEIPFMIHNNFPSEDEQFRTYRGVLEAYAPMSVTMRTLDIGGDKALPYFPIKEENPFLGWRGIRFTLDYTNILLEQLRAMLRANEGLNNLRVMVPMVSREQELDRFLTVLDQAVMQLQEEGYVVEQPEVGIMIEVPSTIWLLERLKDRLDFISIGSNDLTQYLLAVDRNNARVANLYDSLHPSVLMAIRQIVREARRLKIPVSLCGEMAGDPISVVLLLAMGVRQLSMSAHKLPRIKSVIRHLTISDCEQELDLVLSMRTELQMREYLREYLEMTGVSALLT